MRTFDRSFWIIFIPFLAVIGLILFFPYWITQLDWVDFDISDSGEIGDAIGGTMGPFIAISAAILTFFAFWVQFKANEQQRRDLQIERFESKFYEMIRLHRANVEEIEIQNGAIKGRKIFSYLFKELRYCHSVVKTYYENQFHEKKINFSLSDEDVLNIAYCIFFDGIGKEAEKLSSINLNKYDKDFISDILAHFSSFQKDSSINFYEVRFASSKLENPVDKEAEVKPYSGRMEELGHYYRHLFQTVKFVDNQHEEIISGKEKYNYIKTLRAQLSTHEQLLLYYNSLTYGAAWLDENHPYLIRYKMIKNIPLPLCFALSPENKFNKEILELREKGEELFEWHE